MPFHRMNESGQKLWESFVRGVNDGSLNLSLYLNKFVDVNELQKSPTETKVYAVELIDLFNSLTELIKQCPKYERTIQNVFEKDPTLWKIRQVLRDISQDYTCRKFTRRIRLPSGKGTPQVPIGRKVIDEYRQYYELHSKLAERRFTFTMNTKTRLVVGLGEGGTYETGIALLRNYGIPYIPGTAIKGITKHYAVEKLAERYINRVFNVLKKETESLEARHKAKGEEFNRDIFDAMEVIMLALEEENPPDGFLSWNIATGGQITVEELRQVFGTKDKEGNIVFLDALPLPPSSNDWELMEWDIMNPHYGPYYSARDRDLSKTENAPSDWHNPNPIKFLVVKPETKFLFGLRKSKTCTGDCDDLLGKAKALVKGALREHGVGAKTSLGYGRFE